VRTEQDRDRNRPATMFDGSHRTNKREINLAGASASSKSSRQNNLAVARRERQARAAAKARLDSSVRIQRCWRGRRCRRDVAIKFGRRYSEIISSMMLLMKNDDDDDVMSDYDDERGRKRLERLANATTLLAFRMTPALLPYYSSRHNNNNNNNNNNNVGDEHFVAEGNLRQDLLLLENAMRMQDYDPDNQLISPIAARRITSITLILLRQSMNYSSSTSSDNNQQQLRQDNDEHLVQLLDRILEYYDKTLGIGSGCYVDSSLIFTNRTSDYYMSCLSGGRSNTALMSPKSSLITNWMINLFICIRDVVVVATSIDDAVRRRMSSTLLKWCCRIIVQLNETIGIQQEPQHLDELCLAILGTIFYLSSCNFEDSWMDEYLIPCLAKLEHRFMGRLPSRDDTDPCSLMIHYISTAMNHISMSLISITACRTSIEQFECRHVPGFLPTYLAQPSSNSSIELIDVLRDTLYLREHILLNKVIQYANECQRESRQTILIHAIPIILWYTLQHQHDLAILSMFAAQGENVSSWVVESMPIAAESVANFPAAEVYIDSDENSEDDEQPTQQQPQRPASRENSSATTARYLRADLQTLPKLDVLYQTISLKAKKATIDRLRSMPALHVELLVALADKIGKGQWIQELGDSLFSVTQSQLASPSWSNWQTEAQIAYTGALSTIMTLCSGIKVGRNAASPLLAKLAFNETFLHGLWQRSIQNLLLIVPNGAINDVDTSMIVAACEVMTTFCDAFSHQLLAVNDDDFLKRHHHSLDGPNVPTFRDQLMNSIPARYVVHVLRAVLNDLYWVRPVLASDITNSLTDPDSILRFQRARLLLSGTKLFNSLYERWCRLYRVVQFCDEDFWWFPHMVSRGQHENNPIIQSHVTSGGQGSDGMDESSVGSASMDDGVDEPASISANDAGGDELANTFRDPKMARVLTYIPQAMPFSRRVNLFNSLLEADKVRTQDETVALRQMMMNFEDGQVIDNGRERVTIRRDLLYSDSKQLLNELGKRLRKKVQVTFVNKHGQQEAGIDGGGVFKEFLDDLISDAFLPELVRGGKSAEGDDSDDDSIVEIHPDFFTVTPLQTLTVNTALDGNDSLSHYEFLGRVLGKAIYGTVFFLLSFYLTPCLFISSVGAFV